MGATVTKIEGKGAGLADYVRDIPPLINVGPGRTHGALFEALHAGKLGCALNLKTPQGVAILKTMIKDYDIVIEGNRPGVMERLGVGFEDLRIVNPRLIYCSLTGYGQTGPMAQRAGHDINYMALSGLLGLSGKQGEIPPTIGFQAADCAGALQVG
jgi:alpha-methylacyl-CoA racemase